MSPNNFPVLPEPLPRNPPEKRKKKRIHTPADYKGKKAPFAAVLMAADLQLGRGS